MRRFFAVGAAVLAAAGAAGCRDATESGDIAASPVRCGTPPASLRALAPTRLAPGPMTMTQIGRTVWVANARAGTVTPVDAATRAAGRPVRTARTPVALAPDRDGAVWVADADGGRVVRIDPGTRRGRAVASIQRPVSIVTDPVGGTVEVLSLDDGLVYVLLSPSGARTGIEIGVPVVAPARMTLLGGELWVLGAGDSSLSPIGLRSQRVTRNGIKLPGRVHSDLTTGRGSLWVAVPGYRSVLRVEPLTLGLQPYRAPRGFAPTTVAVDDCTVWAGDARGRLLRWIAEPTRERVIGRPVTVARRIGSLVPDGSGGVWAADPGAGTVTHVVPR